MTATNTTSRVLSVLQNEFRRLSAVQAKSRPTMAFQNSARSITALEVMIATYMRRRAWEQQIARVIA